MKRKLNSDVEWKESESKNRRNDLLVFLTFLLLTAPLGIFPAIFLASVAVMIKMIYDTNDYNE